MAAGDYNIKIEQGSTFSRTVIVKDSSLVVRNLSGYTGRLQIRATKDSTSSIIELTTENGRIAITGSEGKIVLSLSAAETAALSFDQAVYDLEIISGAGLVERLIQGAVNLSKEVTR